MGRATRNIEHLESQYITEQDLGRLTRDPVGFMLAQRSVSVSVTELADRSTSSRVCFAPDLEGHTI